ncbi:MAG TPA: hypothetical protein VI756_19805 [Blastocatellia bacterium]
MRRLSLSTLTILLTAIFMFSAGCGERKRPLPTPEPQEAVSESDQDTHRQEDWFLFQREYPFKTIKEDARRKAWEALKQMQSLTPQSSAPGWSPIGPEATTTDFQADPLESGRINSIAICPANTQIILVGGSTGGVWRSTDGAATFAPMTDNQVDLAVGSVQFAPSDSSIAYAGMGDPYGGYLGTGVLKSTDQGATWARVDNGSLPQPGTVTRIKVDPTDPNRVYLAQYDQLDDGTLFTSGFYLSTDGGVSWTNTLPGLPRDFVIDPANPEVLYAGMVRAQINESTQPAGLYKSTDGGATWALAFTAPFEQNETTDVNTAISADGTTVYVYSGGDVEDNGFQLSLEASTDGGSTWQPLSTNGLDPNQFGYDTYIAVDPSNPDNIYVGSRDVYKSADGGHTWTNLTMGYTPAKSGYDFTPQTGISHVDQHAFAFVPGNSTSFYLGNDGGLSFTTNGGQSFSSLNSRLSLTQFYAITLDPLNPNQSYGGAQDNGVQTRLSGNTWNQTLTGDGGHQVINPTNTSMLFAADEDAQIFQYLGFGTNLVAVVAQNSTFGESGSNPRVAFVAPLAGDGVDQNLYFGTWRLFKSTNLGRTWNAPAGSLDLTKGVTSSGADVLTAISISPSNPDIIMTGSQQGRCMLSTDGASKWTDITTGLPNRSITSVTVDYQNPSILYVTFSGFETGHVFMSTDMGAAWTDISGNLADLPVNATLIDPRNSGQLYIGNDIGVFQSAVGSGSWQPLNAGMPPVVVTSLVSQPLGLIQAGTYGRGAYQLTSPLAQSAFQIVPNTTSPSGSVGQTIQVPFNVTATGGFTGSVTLSSSVELTNPAQTTVPPANFLTTSLASPTVSVGGASTLNVTIGNDAIPGVYLLALTGTSGTISNSAVISLTVTAPDFSLGFSPATASVADGKKVEITALVNPINGFSGPVEVAAESTQPGVTIARSSTVQAKNGKATFKVKVAKTTPPGDALLIFFATDTQNGLQHNATFTLTIANGEF